MPVFTDADTLRPGFSLAMELLCSLPPAPASVPLSKLVSDLGVGSQAAAHELIEELRVAGFTIHVNNSTQGAGRIVSVPRTGWLRALEAGQRYWMAIQENAPDAAVSMAADAAPPAVAAA
ncbi:MAG TPA: hypothetical protein VH253_06315 [Phycisphaerae bacterium]|nr:hypothetical protein [Phycisphaerae bacterium]